MEKIYPSCSQYFYFLWGIYFRSAVAHFLLPQLVWPEVCRYYRSSTALLLVKFQKKKFRATEGFWDPFWISKILSEVGR
jgi:hypothetical protein